MHAADTFHLHLKTLVPVGIQGLLHNSRGVSLIAIDCYDGKGIGQAYGNEQTIRRDC